MISKEDIRKIVLTYFLDGKLIELSKELQINYQSINTAVRRLELQDFKKEISTIPNGYFDYYIRCFQNRIKYSVAKDLLGGLHDTF
ncbi:hypothetical protein PVK64_17905 [Aliivibrio sp. S4TY2]|uniref:hypothetical protein n=1 Tax=unclassified Aliivibrio TaxID=2645654 RepID=UPI00237873D4|nr:MULTISPECIES: hypothetical protein [unclassified Aliivibrio]MDD9158041.1 hypothetical protein [Aliivibrio sp. S4TY2]MDD9161916.1 hypothetical protein [Aliivibrio sp. S4TY1]MDD9166038.1 hypothetical protein [Aliivibrio sp. S4MY2]MDD9169996.1 hypothetical protein [Aliivibrio sp. S4MY4]MDD9187047.1 hypothetical protein [Aliivibrio sp. S4MY3]